MCTKLVETSLRNGAAITRVDHAAIQQQSLLSAHTMIINAIQKIRVQLNRIFYSTLFRPRFRGFSPSQGIQTLWVIQSVEAMNCRFPFWPIRWATRFLHGRLAGRFSVLSATGEMAPAKKSPCLEFLEKAQESQHPDDGGSVNSARPGPVHAAQWFFVWIEATSRISGLGMLLIRTSFFSFPCLQR
jgi:hypothetical protein